MGFNLDVFLRVAPMFLLASMCLIAANAFQFVSPYRST